MKLLSLHVDSFGKLKDFDYDFCDGLNVLRRHNGFGKSTLATFIKAMFYGIGSSKKADLAQNDHKHFQPFNATTKFGGSMRFEHSGRVFRVERFFGNTPKEHTFKLFDDTTNKLLQNGVEDGQGELGYRIFGIDGEAFERCLYLPQKEVVVASNDSFVQKLSNLAENSSEQNNCRKACEALTKFYKIFRLDKGEGGLLFELKKKREQKQRQLEENKAVQRKIDFLNQSILTTTKNLMDCDFKGQEIQRRLQLTEQKLAQTNNLSAIVALEERIKQRQQEELQLSQELDGLEKTQPPAPEAVQPAQMVAKEQAGKNGGLAPFAVIAFSLAVAFLALGFGVNILIGAIGAVVFGAVGAVLLVLNAKRKKEYALRLQEIEKGNELAQKEYQVAVEEYQRKEKEVEDHREKTESARTRLSAVKIALADLLSQLTALAPDGSEKLLQEEKSLKVLQSDLRQQLEKISQQCVSYKNRLAEDKKELALREENFVLPSDTEGEIENLTEQITQGQIKYSCAKKAVELLLQAKENLTKGYLPKLNVLFNKNLSLVSNFEFEEATVDANFTVLLRQGGQMRETGYLSTGCRQMCDFALRISLMQCIYGKDLPLLVLDDPFVNYDDANFASAYRLLQQLSEKTQILYLTCHER